MDALHAWAIGLHIATAHVGGAGLESNTPGIWVRHEATGVQLGAYRNSLPESWTGSRRTTFYLGKAWQGEHWGVLAAVATGYGTRCGLVRGPWHGGVATWGECHATPALRPLLVPSYRFGPVLGVRPILGITIARAPGLHLAVQF